MFAALGDKTRLLIVARLCDEGPLSIARLADGQRVSRQAISKHLNALSKCGVVRSQLAGRERIFELRTKRLAEARQYLDQISAQWDRSIERLRAFVESDL